MTLPKGTKHLYNELDPDSPSSALAAGTINYQGSFVLTTIVTDNATTTKFSSRNLTETHISTSPTTQPNTSIPNFPSETFTLASSSPHNESASAEQGGRERKGPQLDA